MNRGEGNGRERRVEQKGGDGRVEQKRGEGMVEQKEGRVGRYNKEGKRVMSYQISKLVNKTHTSFAYNGRGATSVYFSMRKLFFPQEYEGVRRKKESNLKLSPPLAFCFLQNFAKRF